MTPPQLYVGGDPRHGVVRASREIAGAVLGLTPDARSTETLCGAGPVHLHFTDRLFGDSPEQATDLITRLAAARPLTITLHDVPQPSDGTGRLRRRIACYDAAIHASGGVVVSSHHEAALLREGGMPVAPHVIPLALTPAPPAPPSRHLTPEVALLGFVYPGKGHAEAIDAVAALGGEGARRPSVQVLGAPAPGHAGDLNALHARANRQGVSFAVSGWLADAELTRRARTAAVPLAAHTHVSASGSINSWIALGRRPLVADSRYAREIDGLRPGTIRLYEPPALAEAIATALADPLSTWPADGVDTRPHLLDVARDYLDWWAAR